MSALINGRPGRRTGPEILRVSTLAVSLCLVATPIVAATIIVDPSGVGDFRNVQEAIDAATNGDRVEVLPGRYVSDTPISFRGKAIQVIASNGPQLTTLAMADTAADPGRSSVIIFDLLESSDSILDGFRIEAGRGSDWGQDPIEQDGGGGILCLGDVSPTIRRCLFSDNTALVGAGLLAAGGAAPTIEDCRFESNIATERGGAVACIEASPILRRCDLIRNGAVNDQIALGGAVFARRSSPTFEDCLVELNAAGDLPQGIGGRGGGFFFDDESEPRIADSTIEGNVAAVGGGAFFFGLCRPTIERCEFRFNLANDGGGVHVENESVAVIRDCLFRDNRAFGNAGGGALLFVNTAASTVERCRLVGNSATFGGGAQFFGASPQFINCLIALNVGERGPGGFDCNQGSTPESFHCTITDNVNLVGGVSGVECIDSEPSFFNSIVEGLDPEDDCGEVVDTIVSEDPLFASRGSLDIDSFRSVQLFGVVFFAPDHLVDLGDYSLREGSPAIGVGNDTFAPPDDLLGVARDCDAAAPDLGALAFCGDETPRFKRCDTDGNGLLEITDPIFLLLFQFAGGDAPQCDDAADCDDNGALEITDAIFSLSLQFAPDAIPEPLPVFACGDDATDDILDCAAAEACP